MLQTGKYLPCLCLLIKTWLILSQLWYFIYFNFSYTVFTSGEKAKWKIYQQHANFYFKFLRIIHQIAFVLQVRKVSYCSSVTRIRNPRHLFIAKGKFLRVLMRRVLLNRRQIFPPIRGTSHSRSEWLYRSRSWISSFRARLWNAPESCLSFKILRTQNQCFLFWGSCLRLRRRIARIRI